MKTLSLILLLASIIPCCAQLGKTEDQCIQYYGPGHVIQSVGRAKLEDFTKDGFNIRITFWDSRAVDLTFTKPSDLDLTRKEVDSILSQNADAKGWGSAIEESDGLGWEGSKETERVALWNEGDNLSLSCKGSGEATFLLQSSGTPSQ